MGENAGLLSIEALTWLKNVNYGEKSHEERMILIEAAKIAFPERDDLAKFEATL